MFFGHCKIHFIFILIILCLAISHYLSLSHYLTITKNCNHKRLGIYYLLSAFIFGISGTLISVLIRIELYSSGNRIISPENQNFYNINITLHGFIMIFFLVMPGLFGGFGNYFIPIYIGSSEIIYPRINNFSILILFLSYLLIILSIILEFGSGTGWTLYPPLSTSFMNLSPSSTGNLIFGCVSPSFLLMAIIFYSFLFQLIFFIPFITYILMMCITFSLIFFIWNFIKCYSVNKMLFFFNLLIFYTSLLL